MPADLHDAIQIAAEARRGQDSKNLEPYVLHPIRVMLALSDPDDMIVGVLHDVVEDTDVSLADLRARGFSEAVLAGVEAMTKRPGESYDAFIERCKANPIARRVKLADIADNMNLERIPELSDSDWERYQRYRTARATLRQ